MDWTIQYLPGKTKNRPRGAVIEAVNAGLAVKLPLQHEAWLCDLRAKLNSPDGTATFDHLQAAGIGQALAAAAKKLRLKPGARKHLPLLRDLATAAGTAARSRQPWRWS